MVTGILTARIIAVALTAITIIMLFLVWKLFLNDRITLIYITVAVAIPLILVIRHLVTGPGKNNIRSASRLMKIAQCTGVLYSVAVKLILYFNLV